MRKGPAASTVKVKFYHLPEASRVPKFKKNASGLRDQLLLDHMQDGYGKNFLRITCNAIENTILTSVYAFFVSGHALNRPKIKIHNGGSYELMEYLTCWKCQIFHAVMAFLLHFQIRMNNLCDC